MEELREQEVLVTGAAGFIGCRTAELLLQQGRKVVGIDNMNDYYDPRLKRHRVEQLETLSGFVFYPVDIENLSALDTLFVEHDIGGVINLAARAGVRYSIQNPHVYMSTNAAGTLNLLEVMRAHDVRKFVLASTSSLYAGQPMPFTEELPVNSPISPYAASKKAAEMMAYTYHHLFDIDVTILRYFTVYGPAGRPDMSVFRFIRWIDEGAELMLYGDGSQRRDFTYVDDIADGTIRALKPLGFEVINLGTGIAPQQFVDAVREHRAQIVGMSALLTTTLPKMAVTIAHLKEAGLRESVKVMVGGAPVTQRFADEIGADAYGANAAAAVDRAKELVRKEAR